MDTAVWWARQAGWQHTKPFSDKARWWEERGESVRPGSAGVRPGETRERIHRFLDLIGNIHFKKGPLFPNLSHNADRIPYIFKSLDVHVEKGKHVSKNNISL